METLCVFFLLCFRSMQNSMKEKKSCLERQAEEKNQFVTFMEHTNAKHEPNIDRNNECMGRKKKCIIFATFVHTLSLSISVFLNVSASTFGVLCEYSRKKHNCGAIHNARYCMNIRNIFRFLVFTYCELLAHCDAINKLQNRLCHKLK